MKLSKIKFSTHRRCVIFEINSKFIWNNFGKKGVE